MNVRSLLVVAASLATLSGIAACGGSGNSGPKIRTFAASPATVPSLGADVQLVWDVRKAEEISIEPLVGVVTGTSATVHVTETTTFTLTAKRNGRASRKRATVTVAGPSAVSGVVRSALSRQPIPGFVVWIKGHGATAAAADGTFTFDGVETPYDIAVVDPSGPTAVLYLGVTRPDPTLEIDREFGTFRQSILTGSVLPPPPPNTSTFVNVDGTDFLPTGFAIAGTGLNASVNWFNDDTEEATLHTFRVSFDSTGNLAAYTGFVQQDLQLTDGVGAVANMTLAPVGTEETTGTLSLAGTSTLSDVRGFYVFGTPTGSYEDKGFFLYPDPAAIGPAPNQFTLLSPDGVDAGLFARFTVNGIGGQGRAYLPLVPGSTSNEITLAAPPRLLTPIDESVISRDTVFRALTRDDSVKVFILQDPNLFSAHAVVVVTHENEFVLPDLAEIGMDILTLPNINWSLYLEIAPRASVDEAVGPDGMGGISPEWLGTTNSFTLHPEGVLLP